MFKPCPNCGFLVALIRGREASQRCPRCGSAMLEDGEAPPGDDAPTPPRPLSRRTAAEPLSAAEIAPIDHLSSAPHGAQVDAAQARDGAIDAASHTPADVLPEIEAAAVGGEAPVGDVDTAADAIESSAPAAPSFTRRHRPATGDTARRWPWMILLPVLAALLGLQLLLSQRVELARSARWRPLVVAACNAIGCDVPAWRDPAAFTMLSRGVRPHATRAGVLHVTTSLRNEARWPQPLPTVVLSLSDVDGRVLAARAVPPGDYGRRADALVAPGDSVDIAFDVREPSPRVVSFDFQLR